MISDSTQFLHVDISKIKFTAHKTYDRYIDMDTKITVAYL